MGEVIDFKKLRDNQYNKLAKEVYEAPFISEWERADYLMTIAKEKLRFSQFYMMSRCKVFRPTHNYINFKKTI